MVSRTTLLEPVQSLLKALIETPSSPSTLLSTFTRNPLPVCHEHGLPQLAPFLGRSFTGEDGVGRYFQLLSENLEIQNMTFESEDAWLVDDTAMAVSLRGSATFKWKATNQAWDETFMYRIALAEDLKTDEDEDEDGGGGRGSGSGSDADLGGVGIGFDDRAAAAKGKRRLKVCEYRVWADTGAAYLARLGRLGELLDGGCVDGSGRGGYEGIHVRANGGEKEGKKDDGPGSGETRKSLSRKRSGGQDVLGGGLNVYGSCE